MQGAAPLQKKTDGRKTLPPDFFRLFDAEQPHLKVGQPEQLRRWKSAVLQKLQVSRKGDGKVIFVVPG